MNNNYAHRLVGHRGLMVSHPENTLAGFRAAIAAGASYIECDLQLTSDLHPVVLHDHQLSRTAGVEGVIFDKTLTEAQTISVHQPDKFGDRYRPEPIATLEEFLDLLALHPQVTAMIEIKQESIDRFGLTTFTDAVFPQALNLITQVVVISFNADVVNAAKKAGLLTGWVIEDMHAASEQIAGMLLPEYLITDVLKVDVQDPQLWFPPGAHQWKWMLYDVVDPALAKSLMDKEVDLIETADIAGLIEHFESI